MVDAKQLARLIASYGIDTVVINACRSAAGAGSASNMARMLIEAGVKTAIGMAFNVLSQTADIFMNNFYRTFLGQGRSTLNAFYQARLALKSSSLRTTIFGTQLLLKDHIIPVLHCSKASLDDMCKVTVIELSLSFNSFTDSQYEIFCGRESEILQLEKWLAPSLKQLHVEAS